MTNNSFSAGTQVVWDSTSLQWAKQCLRKYQLKMIEGWEPRRLSAHLWFGQHYASAIERFHKLRAEGAEHDSALLTVVRLLLEETWDSETDTPITTDMPAKSRESLLRSVIWYIEEYRDDPLKPLVLANGQPAVELSFKFEIAPGIMWAGHFDRIASLDGNPCIVDQKTTGSSSLGSYYFDGFSPDTQFTGYITAGRIAFGIPALYAVIDAAQIGVGYTRFARGVITRTEAQIDEWLTDTLWWIALAQRATREANFPMNTSSCSLFGGCEFRQICASSPHVRQNFLEGSFHRRVWDPSKER